jgi:hypothetical protein
MSKPGDIPQDIWNEAEHIAGLIAFYAVDPDPAKRNIAVAAFLADGLLEERERCATIAAAETLTGQPPGWWSDNEIGIAQAVVRATAKSIAHAIRNPSPAADPSRAANSSPAALDAASNDDFATIPHLGPVA